MISFCLLPTFSSWRYTIVPLRVIMSILTVRFLGIERAAPAACARSALGAVRAHAL